MIGPLNGMKANVLTVAICCGSGIVRRWPETVNFHEHDGSLAKGSCGQRVPRVSIRWEERAREGEGAEDGPREGGRRRS